MKSLIILASILSLAIAKQAETKAEKFECIAKNLRDKKLLDNEFKFSENSQQLECEAVIAELKEKILRDNLDLTTLREETEDSKASKKLLQDNMACIRGELTASGYPETMMMLSVYEVSRNLVMKQRKLLITSTKAEGNKKMQISVIKCVTGPIFGEMFDNIIKGEEEQAIEGKQINYCIRKYVVDHNLVNTNEFPVNPNRDNIETNFECEEKIKTAIESLEETVKEMYKGVFKSEVQLHCLTKVILAGKGLDFTTKAFVLSEVDLTEDRRTQFRSEFVENFVAINEEIVKCV